MILWAYDSARGVLLGPGVAIRGSTLRHLGYKFDEQEAPYILPRPDGTPPKNRIEVVSGLPVGAPRRIRR